MELVEMLCGWVLIFASLYLVCVFIGVTWGLTSGMARITLGPNVTDIRGRVGSVVYSIWKSGVSYVRQAANVVYNPHSGDQSTIRAWLTILSKYWYDSLSEAQRIEWNDWAQTQPGKGNKDGGVLNIIKGNGGIMSGYNAFLMANLWLRSVCRPVTLNAPLGHQPPSAPTGVTAAYAGGTVTLTWVEPQTHKAGAQVRIWMMNHNKIGHRQEVMYTDFNDTPRPLLSFKGANGGTILFADAPGQYAFQMDTVDLDGTKSEPSNVAEVTVT